MQEFEVTFTAQHDWVKKSTVKVGDDIAVRAFLWRSGDGGVAHEMTVGGKRFTVNHSAGGVRTVHIVDVKR
jgi:hypothetical protein